jgi:hypothetical protein
MATVRLSKETKNIAFVFAEFYQRLRQYYVSKTMICQGALRKKKCQNCLSAHIEHDIWIHSGLISEGEGYNWGGPSNNGYALVYKRMTYITTIFNRYDIYHILPE